jgi:hypothetical protein
MRRGVASFSFRLFALSLALVLGACGDGSSADETVAITKQPLSSASKPVDTGDTPPVRPAPSTMEAEAIDLRGHSRTGDIQVQSALSYSASNTNSATVNTANFYFNLSAGQTLTLGTCGVSGASGTGDTYLRFYDPSGVQVAFNDDSCGGRLSNFSYTLPASGTYRLSAGCFGSGSCSGMVAYSINGALSSYSASNTNSATVNTANFYFNLSAGQTLTLGTCGVSGASGSGDTYLRFYNPSGVQVAFNDDSCGGRLSNFSYTIPVSGTYRLSAGCYGSGSCSGRVAYTVASVSGTWTSWFDYDNPSGVGDYETRADVIPGSAVCNGAMPIDIQCRTLSGVDWRAAGEVYTCSPSAGGYCVNSNQPDGFCLDYEVRFLCP